MLNGGFQASEVPGNKDTISTTKKRIASRFSDDRVGKRFRSERLDPGLASQARITVVIFFFTD
jgi:hypothetical protein